MTMTSPEQFASLLREAAPLVPGATALVRIGESTWAIAFDDEMAVETYADAENHRLTLAMLVGELNESHSTATLRALMLANGLWRETGGLTFALDAAGQGIELRYESSFDGLEPNSLSRMWTEVAERGRAWAELLATPEVFDSPELEEHFDTLLNTGVRV